MFLTLLEKPADAVTLSTRGAAYAVSTSWMVDAPVAEVRDTQRIELAPGIFLVRIKQWLPTTVLDVAEQLPYDYDVMPVKRRFPFPDWHAQAACAGKPEAVFFGAQAAQPPFSRGALRTAREICRGCPVARTCLTHAMELPEEYGVWAGTSGGQRQRLAERIRAGEQLTEVVEECLIKLSRSARPRRLSPSRTVAATLSLLTPPLVVAQAG